jgi:ABC-type Na+ transport system ATPase subunit NatA
MWYLVCMTTREELDLMLDGMSEARLRALRDDIRLEETVASKALEFSKAMRSRSEFHDLVFNAAMRLIAEHHAKKHAGEDVES